MLLPCAETVSALCPLPSARITSLPLREAAQNGVPVRLLQALPEHVWPQLSLVSHDILASGRLSSIIRRSSENSSTSSTGGVQVGVMLITLSVVVPGCPGRSWRWLPLARRS